MRQLGDLAERRDVVITLLEATDAKLRSAAVFSLGKFANPEDRERIEALVNDGNGQVRKSALLALGMLGTPESRELAREVAQNGFESMRVRAAALESWARLTASAKPETNESDAQNEIVDLIIGVDGALRAFPAFATFRALGQLTTPLAAERLRAVDATALSASDTRALDDALAAHDPASTDRPNPE